VAAKQFTITSANSINIAPADPRRCFYYFAGVRAGFPPQPAPGRILLCRAETFGKSDRGALFAKTHIGPAGRSIHRRDEHQ